MGASPTQPGALQRRRDESGSALVETVWLGVLLLIPLLWLVLGVFSVQRDSFVISAAAREAGRAFMLAPDDVTGERAARQVVEQVLGKQGSKALDVTVEVDCASPTRDCHSGGAVVTLKIKSKVPVPWMPTMFDRHPATIAVSASHSVPYGEYRSNATPSPAP